MEPIALQRLAVEIKAVGKLWSTIPIGCLNKTCYIDLIKHFLKYVFFPHTVVFLLSTKLATTSVPSKAAQEAHQQIARLIPEAQMGTVDTFTLHLTLA